ncbi:glycoside hydrolase family 2 TIM barrel-domain containing protein [Sinomicrobium sp. M5D2P17]
MKNFRPNTLCISVILLVGTLYALHGQNTDRVYLSGKDKDNTKRWEFKVLSGRNRGDWTQINVPGHWETQGFGSYTYGFDKTNPDEIGYYKKEFQAENSWKDKEISIVFEGVMTEAEVKINGKPAGPVHKGGFYRFSYDISGFLDFDKNNLLEVTVRKVSTDASVNEAERIADFWTLAGIYRPVYLEIKPQTNIGRIAVNAEADGQLAIDVYGSDLRGHQEIKAQLYTLEGEKIGEPVRKKINKNEEKVRLENKYENVKTWNPEFPYLYKLQVSILDKGKLVHTTEERIGFRTVELRPKDGIYVNGRKVIFRGVNRHSFFPESGRTLNRELHLQDLGLIKEMNMNAVRMSHYPPDVDFLHLCDSLGLFVIDELTGWQAGYDTEVGRPLVRSLVTRDVNHPSVVLWANGNEGGWNTELDGDYALYDPQKRPVIHPWERFNHTDTKHYPDFNYVTNVSLYSTDIFFPTEFMHGLYDGGHGAGLEDFWDLMLRNPLSAGGFLWVFSDEGLARDDMEGKIDTRGNLAPDGILGPYREKEGSFYTIREIWSPIVVGQKSISPGFDGKLPVENRYIYTDLKDCRFTWSLKNFPGPDDGSTEVTVMKTGEVSPISLQPGEKGFMELGLPANWNTFDALYLMAIDPHDNEVFTWSWPLRGPEGPSSYPYPAASGKGEKIRVSQNNDKLFIKVDRIEYVFDRSSGYLDRVKNGEKTISISKGPMLAGYDLDLENFKHYRDGDAYMVRAVYKKEPYFQAVWTFRKGHPAELNYEYKVPGGSDFMGITFQYPEKHIKGMKWLGKGPYRVWKNRLKGVGFGVWKKSYNNTVTGESGWEYPEFKGYHADLHWVKIDTDESPFTIHSGTSGLFFQMLSPEKPRGAGNDYTSPPFPEGDLGFLHAISPIGTKFHAPETLGPQGQKNIMINYTPIKGRLWFDFR